VSWETSKNLTLVEALDRILRNSVKNMCFLLVPDTSFHLAHLIRAGKRVPEQLTLEKKTALYTRKPGKVPRKRRKGEVNGAGLLRMY